MLLGRYKAATAIANWTPQYRRFGSRGRLNNASFDLGPQNGERVTIAMQNAVSSEIESRWISAHIGLTCQTVYGPEVDCVLTGDIEPLIRKLTHECLIESFFFIRYSEGGHHLRLRVRAKSSDEDMVRQTLEQVVACLINRPTSQDVLATVTRLDWVPYEPEITRYGGSKAIAVAESVFNISSIAAFSMLSALRQGRSVRLGKGALAMLVLAVVFGSTRDNVLALLEQYSRVYLRRLASTDGRTPQEWSGTFDSSFENQAIVLSPYVDEALRRLRHDESLEGPLEHYRTSCERRRDELVDLCTSGRCVNAEGEPLTWKACLSQIIPSYIHMMNNRLGIHPVEESFLAHMLSRSLMHSSIGWPP